MDCEHCFMFTLKTDKTVKIYNIHVNMSKLIISVNIKHNFNYYTVVSQNSTISASSDEIYLWGFFSQIVVRGFKCHRKWQRNSSQMSGGIVMIGLLSNEQQFSNRICRICVKNSHNCPDSVSCQNTSICRCRVYWPFMQWCNDVLILSSDWFVWFTPPNFTIWLVKVYFLYLSLVRRGGFLCTCAWVLSLVMSLLYLTCSWISWGFCCDIYRTHFINNWYGWCILNGDCVLKSIFYVREGTE